MIPELFYDDGANVHDSDMQMMMQNTDLLRPKEISLPVLRH